MIARIVILPLLSGLLYWLSSPASSFPLAARCRWLERPWGALPAAAAFVLLRTWFPQVFPGNEAHNLYEWPLLIQVQDLGGVPLLLFCVGLVNFLVVRALLCWRERVSPLPPLAAAVILLVVLTAYGGWRLNDLHRQMAAATGRQTVRVVSVQPDVPARGGTAQLPLEDRNNDIATALSLGRTAAFQHPGAGLAVLPELPSGYDCRDAALDLPRLARETGMAFMVPCAAMADSGSRFYYNSVGFADKRVVMGELFRKNILVPFGEYIPLEHRFPALRRLFPGVMPFLPGTATLLYDLGNGQRAMPSLCYEVVFSGHVRRFVEQGGNLLINMVDDAWFGNSSASLVHLSLAVYRSVEYRLPLVRVTNSGVGAFVQPTGEIVAGTKTGLFQRVVTGTELFIPHVRSLYFRIGDALLYVMLLVFGSDVARRWKSRSLLYP